MVKLQSSPLQCTSLLQREKEQRRRLSAIQCAARQKSGPLAERCACRLAPRESRRLLAGVDHRRRLPTGGPFSCLKARRASTDVVMSPEASCRRYHGWMTSLAGPRRSSAAQIVDLEVPTGADRVAHSDKRGVPGFCQRLYQSLEERK